MFYSRFSGVMVIYATFTFTAMAAVPATPSLVSPSNGQTGVANPTLRWNASTGATYYTVQISADPNFNTSVTGCFQFAPTTFNFTSPVNQVAYYWRVNAMNASGPSSWSPSWHFTASSSNLQSPNQFISKLYTDALGRIPDQGGWQSFISYIKTYGCTQANLVQLADAIFGSTEYVNLGYDNEQKIVTAYRALLSRDPDPTGFQYFLGLLNSGYSITYVVNSIMASSEFSSLYNLICSSLSYGWRTINIPVTLTVNRNVYPPSGVYIFAGGTGADLQNRLNTIPPGATVALCQKDMVLIDQTLVIPSGKTLCTFQQTGTLSRNKYAAFGRLVRHTNTGTTTWPLVQLNGGAHMQNIWLDGQESRIGRPHSGWNSNCTNVYVHSGMNTSVIGCVSSETAGWSNIVVDGQYNTLTAASNILIQNNLITSYHTKHFDPTITDYGPFSDGISCYCEGAIISGNEVVDPTDVGIVLFGQGYNIDQHTIIQNNTILNAGNSAFAALCIDQWIDLGPSAMSNMTGSSIAGNILWTGTIAHYDIAIACGTRPWYGPQVPFAQYASVCGNSSNTQVVNCNMGICVANLQSSTVLNNSLLTNLRNTCGLPLINVGAIPNDCYGSQIQPYSQVGEYQIDNKMNTDILP